jgi:hypothetical protein
MMGAGMNVLKQAAATLAAALLLVNLSSWAGAPAYPLKQSGTGRYLVDQSNAPCMIIGDAPQALIVNLTTNDAAMYFADRNAHGFNSLWINLLCSTYTGGRADASTLDGILPFTGTIPSTSSYDLTTPNEAYFARADAMLNLAAAQGLQVLLDPAETGSFLSVMLDNGTNNCRAYGQFLGNRYKNFPNIIWLSGNDFQTWQTASDDAVARAVALGIQDEDTNHLQTSELNYIVSSSLDDTNWDSFLTLNGTYTYCPTYAQLLLDYNRPHFLPNFLEEANYEFESLQGPVTTAPILRKQEYWTMTSGAAGQMYGNHYIWPFASGWQNYLDTPGAIQIGYLKSFFEARSWFRLVPDTNHVVVISNYGTFSSTGYVADNDYLTGARTPDGSLVVIYTPIIRSFVVDMSQLSGAAVSRWLDPSSGSYSSIAGSPFTNSGTQSFTPPGNNSDGDGGWVLVLETNPPPPPPPPPPMPRFVQQNYATPQSPQTQVTVAFPSLQTAGNANVLAIGWNDTLASISAVGDSAGNAYQATLPVFRGNGLSQAIYYAIDVVGGSNAVTVTFDGPAAYVDLRVTEYSGLSQTNMFDAGASATGDSASADSGPVTVAVTNELLFGAGMTANAFTSSGMGFTQRIITLPDSDIVEDQVAAATGVYDATAGLNAGPWLMQVAAFKAVITNPVAPTLRVFLTSTDTPVIAWPASVTNFILQQTSTLGVTPWVNVTNSVQVMASENQVFILPSATNRFFRLIGP